MQIYSDYYDAEDATEELAQGMGIRYALVERFHYAPGNPYSEFLVMTATEADDYVSRHDAVIQYEAGPA